MSKTPHIWFNFLWKICFIDILHLGLAFFQFQRLKRLSHLTHLSEITYFCKLECVKVIYCVAKSMPKEFPDHETKRLEITSDGIDPKTHFFILFFYSERA